MLVSNLFITATLTFTQPECTAQNMWSETYGGDGNEVPSEMIETNDQGYLIVGSTFTSGQPDDGYIVKVDASGNEMWTKTIGEQHEVEFTSIDNTHDNGYVISASRISGGGTLNQALLVKMDSAGDTLWSRVYGGDIRSFAYSISQTSEGGFIAGGTRLSDDTGYDLWLLKVDSAGDTLWTQQFGSTEHEWLNSVIETSDGYYLSAGTGAGVEGGENAWVAKLDSDGTPIWVERFDVGTAFNKIIEASDQSYVVVGRTFNEGVGGHKGLIMKLDQNGVIQWSNSYLSDRENVFESVLETSELDFLMVGDAAFTSSSPQLWLLKANPTGELIWSRRYLAPLSSSGKSVVETQDQGYVFAGSFRDISGDSNFWLFKSHYFGNTIGYTAVRPNVGIPSNFNLAAFPNPTNNSANIMFSLSVSSPVTISIYNMLGTEIWSYFKRRQSAGTHRLTWDMTSSEGSRLSTGTYIIKLSTPEEEKQIKISLVK